MENFEYDDSQIRKMFEELSPKNRKQALKRAIRSGLNILKKHTISNLKFVVDPGAINKKDKYGNTFRKGIKIRIYRSAKGGLIHILGNYKLKFFETGTKARYAKTYNGKALKKKRYTGRIPAYHFFKSAERESEREVFSSMEMLLKKSIQKINDKYKGKA